MTISAQLRQRSSWPRSPNWPIIKGSLEHIKTRLFAPVRTLESIFDSHTTCQSWLDILVLQYGEVRNSYFTIYGGNYDFLSWISSTRLSNVTKLYVRVKMGGVQLLSSTTSQWGASRVNLRSLQLLLSRLEHPTILVRAKDVVLDAGQRKRL